MDHQMVIAPGAKCAIRMDMLGSLQNPHISFLTWGVRTIVEGKANWKVLKLPSSPVKIVHKTVMPRPGRAGIRATLKDLKDVITLFNSSICYL